MSQTKDGTIKETGAIINQQLIGIDDRNRNLIIEIYKTQEPKGGRIVGEFKIISAGDGSYAKELKEFEGETFSNAKKFIDAARLKDEKITHIINRNGLKIYK